MRPCGQTSSLLKMAQAQILRNPILIPRLYTIPGNVWAILRICLGSVDADFPSVLTRYFPKAKVRKQKSLIGGSDVPEVEEQVHHYFLTHRR